MILLALGALSLSACAPALDWREFVPEGSAIQVEFPCRPDRSGHTLNLDGAAVRMEMLSCPAAGMTFAVAYADVADPTRVASSLQAMRVATAANVKGTLQAIGSPAQTFAVAGMTPNAQSGRWSIAGHLPDGKGAHEQVALFARGLRIYQASIIGAEVDPAAAETFIGALKFPA